MRRLQHSTTVARAMNTPSWTNGSGQSAMPYTAAATPHDEQDDDGARWRHTSGTHCATSTSAPSTVRFGSSAVRTQDQRPADAEDRRDRRRRARRSGANPRTRVVF